MSITDREERARILRFDSECDSKLFGFINDIIEISRWLDRQSSQGGRFPPGMARRFIDDQAEALRKARSKGTRPAITLLTRLKMAQKEVTMREIVAVGVILGVVAASLLMGHREGVLAAVLFPKEWLESLLDHFRDWGSLPRISLKSAEFKILLAAYLLDHHEEALAVEIISQGRPLLENGYPGLLLRKVLNKLSKSSLNDIHRDAVKEGRKTLASHGEQILRLADNGNKAKYGRRLNRLYEIFEIMASPVIKEEAAVRSPAPVPIPSGRVLDLLIAFFLADRGWPEYAYDLLASNAMRARALRKWLWREFFEYSSLEELVVYIAASLGPQLSDDVLDRFLSYDWLASMPAVPSFQKNLHRMLGFLQSFEPKGLETNLAAAFHDGKLIREWSLQAA